VVKNSPNKFDTNFQQEIGQAHGVLGKFYTENQVQNVDFEQFHYEIIVIGETSSGKDSMIANLVKEDIGYSGKEVTTKFPEKISKLRSDRNYYRFYKEGEIGNVKEFEKLEDLKEYRKNIHLSYQFVTFHTYVIEIYSNNPNTIAVTILNLPGFKCLDYNDLNGEEAKIILGLENEVKRICSKGLGSI
jgi:septin family protein